MSEIELKPCPFCGGKAEIEFSTICPELCSVLCRKCKIETYGAKNIQQATETWNRRADNGK